MQIPDYNNKIIPIASNPKNQGFKRLGIKSISLPELSDCLEGFEKGELITIAAPSGGGKTQLGRTLTLDFIEQGLNVLYISFEIPYRQLFGLFQISGLNEMYAKNLILQPEEISERDITFVEKLAENPIDVLVVDDVRSLEEKYSIFRRDSNQAIVLGGLMERLKAIAINKEIIVITMAQLLKNSSNSKDTTISDVADSGGIIYKSDTLLAIKRLDEIYSTIEIVKSRWAGVKKKFKVKSVNKKFIKLDPYDYTPAELVDNVREQSFR